MQTLSTARLKALQDERVSKGAETILWQLHTLCWGINQNWKSFDYDVMIANELGHLPWDFIFKKWNLFIQHTGKSSVSYPGFENPGIYVYLFFVFFSINMYFCIKYNHI